MSIEFQKSVNSKSTKHSFWKWETYQFNTNVNCKLNSNCWNGWYSKLTRGAKYIANYVMPTFFQNPNCKHPMLPFRKSVCWHLISCGNEVPLSILFKTFLSFNPKRGQEKNQQTCHSKCQIILRTESFSSFSSSDWTDKPTKEP